MKVRITHKSSGCVAVGETESLDSLMKELESTVKGLKLQKNKVLTDNRSEKMRTYNFKDNRVTNHLSGESFYNLQDILDGDLDKIIDDNALACNE